MFFFGEKCHSVCLQNEIIIPVIPSFQFVRIFVFTHKKCGYLVSCGALLPLKGKKKSDGAGLCESSEVQTTALWRGLTSTLWEPPRYLKTPLSDQK